MKNALCNVAAMATMATAAVVCFADELTPREQAILAKAACEATAAQAYGAQADCVAAINQRSTDLAACATAIAALPAGELKDTLQDWHDTLETGIDGLISEKDAVLYNFVCSGESLQSTGNYLFGEQDYLNAIIKYEMSSQEFFSATFAFVQIETETVIASSIAALKFQLGI